MVKPGLFVIAECSVGRFGLGCGAFCSCLNGGVCNSATGDCQCRPGWVGTNCAERKFSKYDMILN